MFPGDLEYSFGCRVLTCTLKEFVEWKLLPQCLHLTLSNFRGEAVEAGLHFTKRMCCLSPPFVKKRLQCGHWLSLGLFRGAMFFLSEPYCFCFTRVAARVESPRARGDCRRCWLPCLVVGGGLRGLFLLWLRRVADGTAGGK